MRLDGSLDFKRLKMIAGHSMEPMPLAPIDTVNFVASLDPPSASWSLGSHMFEGLALQVYLMGSALHAAENAFGIKIDVPKALRGIGPVSFVYREESSRSFVEVRRHDGETEDVYFYDEGAHRLSRSLAELPSPNWDEIGTFCAYRKRSSGNPLRINTI